MKFNNDWSLLLKNIAEIREESAADSFSQYLYDYLIAGEDHRFWMHLGVDPIGLVRAIWRTKICGKREGGSTIAMQLVRTLINNYDLSIIRKLKEIYLAVRLTSKYDKKDILRMYLTVAYFGWNMHGIKQACARLGFDEQYLTEYDAASLVARLKYPEPKHHSSEKKLKIHLRANHILKRSFELKQETEYGTI